MLIRFTVGNFLSFDDVQEFSMISGKVRSKSERLYIDDHIKLLKFAAVFGANASGKSNLVSAMEFAQKVLNFGFPSDTPWKYCKLSDENKQKPSYFEFEIEIDRKYYAYGFEAVLSEQRLCTEWLHQILPLGQDRILFSRDVSAKNYSIGAPFQKNSLSERLNIYADDIRSDPSVLFLKALNQNKNTLYAEHEEAGIFRMVFQWLSEKLDINFPDQPISMYSYFVSHQNFERICTTLSAFGTGITNYAITETPPEKMLRRIPQTLLNELLETLHAAEKKPGSKEGMPSVFLRRDKSFYILSLDREGELISKTIQFNHGNPKIFFSLSEESDGTARLLDLLTILFESTPGYVYIIDEIDRCLHPQLTFKFISEYLKIAQQLEIQLVVTTHESRLLNFDLLRRDEIWFIDKKMDGSSSVYSLDEYNERFDKKIDKAYLEGRYGGVPVFGTVPLGGGLNP